ncbi:PocR ligand-binding domain-containing protein [Desulfoplanes sp.]
MDRTSDTGVYPRGADFDQERVLHLKQVLLAIRNVGRLITTENDPECLVDRACEVLTSDLGYHNTWIGLTDPGSTRVTMTVSSGFGPMFEKLNVRLLGGDFPRCMRRGLGRDHVVVVQDPVAECSDCPLAEQYAGRAGMTRSLVHAGVVYGIISVSVPARFAKDPEEISLFDELAHDIGFALHRITATEETRRLNHIVTTLPEPMAFVSSDYTYLAVNDIYATLYSTTREGILGRSVAEFCGQEVFATEIKPRLDHCLGGEEIRYTLNVGFPDGSSRWMDMVYCPYRDHAGMVTGVISHGRDVTSHVEIQKKLRDSEQRVRNILDTVLSPEKDVAELALGDVLDVTGVQALMDDLYQAAGIPIGIVDTAGKVLVATGWQEICTRFHRNHPDTCKNCMESDTLLTQGVEPGTFKAYRCKNNMWDIATPLVVGGRHLGNIFIGQFLYGDEEPDLERFRDQARRYGFDETAYLAALDKVPRWSRDKVEHAMRFYAQLSHVMSTNAYARLKLASLLEEQKLAKEQLAQLNTGLRAKNRELEQILYVTSHDLRSPLVNIDGYARELSLDLGDLETICSREDRGDTHLWTDIKESLRFIRSSASRMDQLLAGLLRLSRLGRSALDIRVLDMDSLLRDTVENMDFRIRESQSDVRLDGLPSCKGDPVQVGQVFANLVDNALKYRHPDRRGRIRISGQARGGRAVYCVQDNGRGIDPAHLDKVFEIFHRLEPDQGEGEGLGLTIVRRVMDRLGGDVWAESDPDGGSSFFVALPRGEDNDGQQEGTNNA